MKTSPWNKDRTIGQKRPLQISHIWGIWIRLELEGKTRDLALFNMALDSKLRGCDLVKLKVSDAAYGSSVSSRATVLQQKTGSPVQFEMPLITHLLNVEELSRLLKNVALSVINLFILDDVSEKMEYIPDWVVVTRLNIWWR